MKDEGKHVMRAGLLAVGAIVVATAVWAGQDIAPRDRGEAAPPPARTSSRSPAPAAPDTTGRALWAYVEAAKYRSWPLWPGKEEFFEGEEPHGALLTVYVDSSVYRALEAGATTMPPRSIIVKENFGPDRKLRAHTIMYKVPGFSPEHRDWFWGQFGPDGKVLAAGRVQLCWQCHDVARKYDDLWILRDQEYLESQGTR